MSFAQKLARLGPLGGDRALPVRERRELVRQVELPALGWSGTCWSGSCGFDAVETDLGLLHRLQKPARPGSRVGHAPVWAARTADPGPLALLALDPSIAGCDPTRALYLDTETTGLSGGTGTVAFLIGLASFDDTTGTFVIEQLLLRSLAEEAPVLAYVREKIERASMLVTFNGKTFDLPLLKTRSIMCRLGALAERPHLDLLHVARRLHKHRLPSCSLKSIEDRILGQERVGDVSGADIPMIYGHFLRTGDESALEPVVEHNALDVISMAALVGLYGEPFGAMFSDAPGKPGALTSLTGHDLAHASRIARRSGHLDSAEALASASVERGGGAHALVARADVAKARGDKARALADYEAALSMMESGDPSAPKVAASLRHELAKLYEHHARAYEEALSVLASGTIEDGPSLEKRTERLKRKRARTRDRRDSQ